MSSNFFNRIRLSKSGIVLPVYQFEIVLLDTYNFSLNSSIELYLFKKLSYKPYFVLNSKLSITIISPF